MVPKKMRSTKWIWSIYPSGSERNRPRAPAERLESTSWCCHLKKYQPGPPRSRLNAPSIHWEIWDDLKIQMGWIRFQQVSRLSFRGFPKIFLGQVRSGRCWHSNVCLVLQGTLLSLRAEVPLVVAKLDIYLDRHKSHTVLFGIFQILIFQSLPGDFIAASWSLTSWVVLSLDDWIGLA